MAETITLNTLIASLRAKLADVAFVTFDQRALEQAIRDMLREINQVSTHEDVGTITLAATGREIDISSLTPCIPWRIWLPYTAAAPEDPPNSRTWQRHTNTLIYIYGGTAPQAGDVCRVFFSTGHTIDGLDAATTTTLDDAAIGPLLMGAAAEAVASRRREIMETTKLDPDATLRFEKLYDQWRTRMNSYILTLKRSSDGGFVNWSRA